MIAWPLGAEPRLTEANGLLKAKATPWRQTSKAHAEPRTPQRRRRNLQQRSTPISRIEKNQR